MAETAQLRIQAFFDEPTHTASYLVWDGASKRGAVIDPVLAFDAASGEANTDAAEAILVFAAQEGVTIDLVLETHVHADHLSAAPYFKEKIGAKVAIGEHIRDVQRIFRVVFNAEDVSGSGAEFDVLFKDGDTFAIGGLTGEVIHTPGHTPACVTYRIGDVVFVGDTLFMPDYGTARADFPGGDARQLFRSIKRILALPETTRIFVCHDYKAPGRDCYAWETTVGEERRKNLHVRDGVDEEAFVKQRTARDATLSAPSLLMPSIQVNMRAGQLPPSDSNGIHYLKIPVKLAS
ncbi:beta-lactamase [Afipia sp. P52-10]|uniref:MBL fold metallo-hydrolase n=1 Tax=Afipia sp. P52-10 TaxID=1429916 RepID=UPI0003DF15A7|nr:MBL fold metallo-hydrolase [Afipia sp. P52-10]ETR75027.1 beta-lactamase [Afipia sp. P52-10]